MATFAYVARDTSGTRVSGTLAGASRQFVLAELQSRQLAPVEVRQVRARRRLERRVTIRQLAQAYRQLSDLLRAGVPLLRALRLLGRSKSSPRLAAVMAAVADEVADGARLADSLAAHEGIFPSIQVAMVRAGERGGFLESVLERLGTFLEHQADLRGKVISNLIYPIVLLSLGVVIVVAALVFFVPQFTQFYENAVLPLPTRILLGTSALLTRDWFFVLIGLIAAVTGWWWLRRQPVVRRRMAEWQLRIPQFGTVIRSLAVARFCRILGTLLANGVPLLAAMQISRDATGHPLLAEAIDEASEAVRSGETLASPLASCRLFGEDVLEMISVGESANNLAEVLIAIAETIEKRVDRMLGVLLRLMEPVLLLLLAGIVLFLVIALVVPMMQMSASL